MRLPALVFASLAIPLSLIVTGCDAFADYRISNRTSQRLVTWPSFDECDRISPGSNKGLSEEDVPPHETYGYTRSFAPWIDEPKCIVVTTLDRRLVQLTHYEYGASAAIDDPLRLGIV